MNSGNNSNSSRRDFLKTAGALTASALLPETAGAFNAAGSFLQSRRGWIPMNNGVIPVRSACESATINDKIFFFGGSNGSGSAGYIQTQLWFDPLINTWYGITLTSGTCPAGRDRMRLATDGTTIFVWGGRGRVSTSSAPLNTGGLFTPSGLGSGAWVDTPTAGAPSARDFVRAVAVGGKYMVWGGQNGTTYYNDGGIYDPATNSWTLIPSSAGPSVSARSAHAMVSDGVDKVYIFGGLTSPTTYALDCHVYSLSSGTWSPIAAPGFGLPHVGYCWTGSRFTIWGGGTNALVTYNPATNTWNGGATGVNAPIGTGNGYLYWTGSKYIAFSDGSTGGLYDPAKDLWRPIPTSGPNSSTNTFCVGYAANRLVVWGGISGGVRVNKGHYLVWYPAI